MDPTTVEILLGINTALMIIGFVWLAYMAFKD